MITSFPPAYGGGARRDFNYFGTRPDFGYNIFLPLRFERGKKKFQSF
ncbi:MAG: hypothetical protein LBR79_06100 [Oscillospiraceae bacterium]|nr:hypothetical protein [Oscillospiraceae bacterium]